MPAGRAETHVYDPDVCLREKERSRDPCPWLFNDACAKRTFTRPWPLALKSTRVVNAFGSSAAQKERSQDPGPWLLVLSQPRSRIQKYMYALSYAFNNLSRSSSRSKARSTSSFKMRTHSLASLSHGAPFGVRSGVPSSDLVASDSLLRAPADAPVRVSGFPASDDR